MKGKFDGRNKVQRDSRFFCVFLYASGIKFADILELSDDIEYIASMNKFSNPKRKFKFPI